MSMRRRNGPATGNVSPLTFRNVSFFAGVPAVANTPVNGQITLTGQVMVSAPSFEKSTPSEFIVPISVNDVSGLGVFAFQFDITYDPTIIDPFGPNFGCSTSGTIAGAVGMAPTCNVSVDGTLRVSVSGPIPMTGSGTVLIVYFATDPTLVPPKTSPLTFSNSLFFNGSGPVTNTTFNGQVHFLGPTAAGTSLSGRVLTASGRGVSNARISLTDRTGLSFSAISNPFGYYRIEDVPAGSVYVLQASSKRNTFQPRIVSLQSDLTEVDILAEQ